ncbi:MAG: hypothetical protein KY454_03900 [Actinobacteria bacterium]|nr:hypothetical protein [Actinomycetota bacterium]MBW3649568.1 hypothetical protein [Actinomycetota bacterium]
MAGDFDVSPQTLHVAAEGVGRAADRLDDAVAELRSAMGRLDGCWGDDEPGRAFGGHYSPNGRAMLEQLTGLATALEIVPGGLQRMAERYEEAESDSRIPGRG